MGGKHETGKDGTRLQRVENTRLEKTARNCKEWKTRHKQGEQKFRWKKNKWNSNFDLLNYENGLRAFASQFCPVTVRSGIARNHCLRQALCDGYSIIGSSKVIGIV